MPYRVAFSTAEKLTPELRAELDEMFGVELFDHIGEAQIGPVAGECAAHQGMHLSQNDLFCEFLDPESGAPAEPGGVGELIATHLGPRALPLVRYAPGDAYRLLEGTCRCGNASPRVEFFGQVGAIRKIKGVLIHPAQVQKVLAGFPGVGRFQIVVEQQPGERYETAVLRAGVAGAAAPPPGLAEEMGAQLKATVLITMAVELVPEAEIPEAAAAPRFAEVFVDRREK
jgi:phenylacetate-CoA ligase